MAAATPGACALTTGTASATSTPNAVVTSSRAAAIPASHVRTVTFTRVAGAGRASTLGPDASATTITCSLYGCNLLLIDPGESFGPYGPSIIPSLGAEATVSCTAPVSNIEVNADVAWDRVDSLGPTVYVSGVSSTPIAYSSDICTSGDWQTGGVAIVTAPAGYSPQVFSLTGLSAPLYVDPTECD